jgi:MFS family permease
MKDIPLPFSDEKISRDVRWLLASRMARSIGQGVMVVAFPLYLHALNVPAWMIGGVMGTGIVFAVAVTLLVGPLSDRLGRRRFLVGYECLLTLAAVAALASKTLPVLFLAAVVGGFGRGQNGGAGPFVPVEYAWLAGLVSEKRRGKIFSLNTALGSFGMALGASMAALPAFLHQWFSGADAYRPLFLFLILGSFTSVICLLKAKDSPLAPAAPIEPTAEEKREEDALRRHENGLLAKLVGINALNGVAIGLIGPLLVYWFAAHFGVGPAKVAPVIATGFLLSSFSSIFIGWATEKLGVVRTIVVVRAVGLITLVLLPLSPSFHVAAVLQIIRSALNRGTVGARQALNVSLVRAHRHGLAVSLGNVAMQIPRAAGPVFAGLMFTNGEWALPFFIAAGLQTGYLVLYQRVFGRHESDRAKLLTETGKAA